MIGTLIESRATRKPPTGGSFVSVILHGALIVGAVLATARESVSAPKPAKVEVVYFPTTHLPDPEPRPVEQAPLPVDQLPVISQISVPHIDAPTVVPTTIPLIDPDAIATTDWIGGRQFTP